MGVIAVIVTVDTSVDELPALERHARVGLTRFPEFEGFICGALHKNSAGTRMVQYLQWSSEAAYQACIDDPQWDQVPSTRDFLEIVRSGRAKMNVALYDLIEAT